MLPEPFRQNTHIRRRIGDRGHRLVLDFQPFLSAGALQMVNGGILVQPDGKLLSVVNKHRAEPHQPLIEIRQSRQ